MKTSILYGDRFQNRAFLPHEEIEARQEMGEALDRLPYGVPRFVPAHEEEYQTVKVDVLEGRRKGRLLSLPRKRHVQDQVSFRHHTYGVGFYKNRHRAVKSNFVVVIRPEDALELDRLDRELERISREHREHILTAAKRGRVLTLNDLGL